MPTKFNGLRPTLMIMDDLLLTPKGNTMKIEHKRHTDNANSITFTNGAYALFSYETLVAFYDGRNDYHDEYKYSRTTSKHLSQYAKPRHTNETKLISQQELQTKLKAYMANHIMKDILGEIL